MFVDLVFPPIPGRFRGEIATLEPAGERPDVAMYESVLRKLAGCKETFPADIADVFLKFLAAVYTCQMILKINCFNTEPFFFLKNATYIDIRRSYLDSTDWTLVLLRVGSIHVLLKMYPTSENLPA